MVLMETGVNLEVIKQQLKTLEAEVIKRERELVQKEAELDLHIKRMKEEYGVSTVEEASQAIFNMDEKIRLLSGKVAVLVNNAQSSLNELSRT